MNNDSESSSSGIFFVLKNLGVRNIWSLFWSKLFSVNHYYILKCNLNRLVDDAPKRIPNGEITMMGPDNFESIKVQVASLGAEDRREVLSRIMFYESGFQNCYIMKENEEIMYMQWVIYPAENQVIKDHYGRVFALLGDKQVLIENAFTFPRYRGRAIYNYVTVYLLKMVRDQGYKSAVCYTKKERIIALNEFAKMGFKITKMVREWKLLGKVWRNL